MTQRARQDQELCWEEVKCQARRGTCRADTATPSHCLCPHLSSGSHGDLSLPALEGEFSREAGDSHRTPAAEVPSASGYLLPHQEYMVSPTKTLRLEAMERGKTETVPHSKPDCSHSPNLRAEDSLTFNLPQSQD